MTFNLLRKKDEDISNFLIKNSADGIFIATPKGIRGVNPAVEHLAGLSADELCSPDFDPLILIHPNDRVFVLERIKAFAQDSAPSLLEFRVLRKDGSVRYAETHISALPGSQGDVLGVIRDVTARKLSEQSLRQNEEKYRNLVESDQDGIAIIQDSLFKYLNPKAAEIVGFSPEELIGTPFNRYLVQRSDDSAIAENQRGIFEASVKHKGGETVEVELNAGHIVYDGKPAEIISLRHISAGRQSEEELSQTLDKLRKAMGATIQAMSLTIETRDPYTAGHQKRVSDLARAIAVEMNLSKEDIDAIRMAASIHDLGKISIPAEILSKPGKISEFEFRLIQNHPKIGFEILRTIDFPWPIADIVLQHHERMNGSGYPNGLSGEKIHPIARILAVADVVEAMVSHRPYRSALTLGEAIHEISKNRDILYDSEAVDACKKLFVEGRFSFKS